MIPLQEPWKSVDSYNRISQCPYCGLYHESVCFRIKAIDYYSNGQVSRIEFFPTMPEVGNQEEKA